jgi:hypothetical protein
MNIKIDWKAVLVGVVIVALLIARGVSVRLKEINIGPFVFDITSIPPIAITISSAPNQATHPPTVPQFSEKKLTIVYPSQDGLILRAEPSDLSTEVARVYFGAELTVADKPIRGKDCIRWWRVTNPYAEGWVKEWQQNIRYIKPRIECGDTIEVYDPIDGNVDLWSQNCTLIVDNLGRGTILKTVDGPIAECGGASLVDGREWWYVTSSTGPEGWIAEFGSTDKETLIAPRWFVELADQAPPCRW